MSGTGATLVVLALAVAGVVGCASNRHVNLSNSARNLEYQASVLARDTRAAVVHEDGARDAGTLARDARDLRLAVEQGATRTAVHAAFDRVSRSYRAVRAEVARLDSDQAQRDLGPLTYSYRTVARELGVRPQGEEPLPAA